MDSFSCTPVHSKAFKEVKAMVAEDTMRIHPKFSKPLIVHIDASDYQTSGVVSQEGKSAAYFSRKFNSAQKNKRQ